VHPPTENPYKYSEEDMGATLEFAQTIVEGRKYEGARLTFTNVSVGFVFPMVELVTKIYIDEEFENETDVPGVAPSFLGKSQVMVRRENFDRVDRTKQEIETLIEQGRLEVLVIN